MAYKVSRTKGKEISIIVRILMSTGLRICMTNRGKGVCTAELQPAEVDPCFKICLDPIAALQIKDTRPEFQSDRTKIGGVSLISDASYFSLHGPF